MREKPTYDVIILGSSLAGTMAAAILARHGVEVLLLEKGSHPRFAIGEATTPDISFRLKNLAHKYGVPEFLNLSTFYKLRDHVGPASGVKRGFSFLYHREGEEQNPEECHQYPTLSPPMGPDCHLFRQDTDAYLLAVAIRYGAESRQQTAVETLDFEDDRVTVSTAHGETLSARFLIDAAGFGSPVARALDLRDDSGEFLTNSRAIFNHFLGVRLYDQVAGPAADYGLKHPLSQGTLHHVFDGGWFWVIPFNNHSDAVNPLCSAGLVLDRARYPETGRDPEEEFWEFVGRFPAVARQFDGAQPVRNWIASRGRLQYSSKQMTGHRYCLMPSAAAFVDPLFSSGINLTLAGLDMLAKRLLHACATDDFSVEPFRDIEAMIRRNETHYDEVIANAFYSFRDFELWDAWFRVWVVGLLVATALNANLFLKYLQGGDSKLFERSEHPPYNGSLGSAFGPHTELYQAAADEIERVRSAAKTPHEGAEAIRALFASIDYFPTYFRWSELDSRSTPAFTVGGMTRMYFWYRWRAPTAVRDALFDWSPLTAYRFILRSIRESRASAARRRRSYFRDVFRAWNQDWNKDWSQDSAAPAKKR